MDDLQESWLSTVLSLLSMNCKELLGNIVKCSTVSSYTFLNSKFSFTSGVKDEIRRRRKRRVKRGGGRGGGRRRRRG